MLDPEELEMMISPDTSSSFFDTYFSASRFGIECFLAAMAVSLNFAAMILLCRTRNYAHGKSVYRVQYANLTVVNIFSCALSWLCNNLLYLFQNAILQDILSTQSGICRVLLYMVSGSFVSSAFGMLNTLCMLGFATTQYFAICRPLVNMDLIRRRRVILFAVGAWIFSFLSGYVPFGIAFTLINRDNCTTQLATIGRVALMGCNISISVMTVMYLTTIALCLRIYAEVRLLQNRLSRFRFIQNVHGERRVFITTVILLCTLTVFFLPYTIVYLLSLNMADTYILQHGGIIYYMNFLPYFKFLSDPLVYGARMRDLHAACRELAATCCKTKCPGCDPEMTSLALTPSTPSGGGSTRLPLKAMRSFSMTTL
ncbi:hypothetical protein LSH36_168g01010 [Paralvinella palmiformis]|uniref:G-protein coupled receptors family 1 profile domain-containing protein n=1 Tax=Paralvinella palmiformis TaxID=53620 RepID=A0AAD9JSH4_9ANNE|nr:hypothetical protein LSH36_168g01010 [Paralvinella palmiformis]